MGRWLGALPLAVVLVIGTGTASAVPDKFPKPKYEAIRKALVATGVLVCAEPKRGGDLSGAYERQDSRLYLAANRPTCSTDETSPNLDADGFLEVGTFSSQNRLDRGSTTLKRFSESLGSLAPLLIWKWAPHTISLDAFPAPSPELIADVQAAMKSLRPKAKVLIDNR